MKNEEIVAIKQAILMEIEGYEFYKMAQSQFDNPDVKDAFAHLMEEEKMHAKWLEEAHQKLNTAPDSKETLSFLETTPSAKIFDWSKLMQKSAQSPLAVFGIALELEKASMDHYQKQSELATEPQLKTLFDILMRWEKSHYDQFNGLYKELKDEWWAEQNFAPY